MYALWINIRGIIGWDGIFEEVVRENFLILPA
jgi:hypothetical protein